MNINNKILFASLLFLSITLSCNDAARKVENDNNKLSTDLVKNNQSLKNDNKEIIQPIVEILEPEYDFGIIPQGAKATHDYKIKNIGNSDLLITSAKGSCGCTVPEWPREPIKPGNEANIKVTFNSKGKTGKQNKRVTLMTNAIPNVKILTIKGEVNTN